MAWWRGGLEGFCFDPILSRHTPPHPNIKATTIAHIDHTSKQAANQELERWLPISTMLSQASSSLCYFHCSCNFNLVHIHHTFPSCLCIFIVYHASQSINLNYIDHINSCMSKLLCRNLIIYVENVICFNLIGI